MLDSKLVVFIWDGPIGLEIVVKRIDLALKPTSFNF
jgi:hypothetical protein